VYIKFKQSMGDVVENKLYKVARIYENNGIVEYKFVDDANEEAIIQKVIDSDMNDFFEIVEDVE